ncbi:MAG: histidine kinase [Paenibacillaceae bacterium]|nr:histidine kinase [Paenibacillaceae bacterium]
MTLAVGVLVMIVLLLIGYVLYLQLQLRRINRQLDKRLLANTRQPLSLELINRDLNRLAANINTVLKAEENLRLNSIREEKRFKELIANISHDLRTPVTAIKGYQQLLDRTPLSGDQRQKLQIAQKHAAELGILIEHFFEYSYLLNSEPEPAVERINLTNLVAECLAQFITAFEEKHLSVRFAESAPVFAFADKGMVIRIVQNLIRNGVMHAAGDMEVEVGIGGQTGLGEQAGAEVQAGLEQPAVIRFRNPVREASAIEVDRLFDRFYTADQARGRTTGLGLSIVRLLTERLGGRASASMKDGALEIRVELPSA